MAFLFGSEATKRAHGESDVDIAVWLKGPYSATEIEHLWQEVEIRAQRNVDLIVLNDARPTVAWAAMRGIPLVIKDYGFFLRHMLMVSDEAEFIQDFTLELFSLRRKLREAG